MKLVKLSINSSKESVYRQSPNNDGIWGQYKFIVNEEIEECDFWVVYSKGERKSDASKVAPENIIFISGEPEPIYHYANKFVKQFSTVVTTRQDIDHSNIINLHPAQPWWVGRRTIKDGSIVFDLLYEDLFISPEKTKLISVITSNKSFTKGHNDRIHFVQKLKSHFGSYLDVYGKGINDFDDKWSVLKDYKYHIVIENSSYRDYWTEKLADCFLADSFPFYHGCTNLNKYFQPNSYKYIDIYDLKKSIKVIEESIENNLWEKNYVYLKEAKKLIMHEHNILPYISKICDNMDASLNKKQVIIKNEMFYIDVYKIPMLLRRIFFKYFYR